MRKLLVVLGVLVLVPGLAPAQSYYVDYFSNNPGPVTGAPDQSIRIINVDTGHAAYQPGWRHLR